MTSHHYTSGMKLLSAVIQLQDDIKCNYEKGNIHERTLANIAGLQIDLCASYLLLLGEDGEGPIVGRSVILRSILENQGTILHIKGDKGRAERYLGHVNKMQQRIKDNIEGRETPEKDRLWSESVIAQRVGLIDKRAVNLYDTLSDFLHGNNVQYLYDTKELTDAYIMAIDACFIGILRDFIAELAKGLSMEESKRKMAFKRWGT